MFLQTLLTFALTAPGSLAAVASSPQGCEAALFGERAFPADGVFTAEDRRLIAVWFKDSGTALGGRAAWDRVMNLYRERRVAHLPERDRGRVNAWFEAFLRDRCEFVPDASVFEATNANIKATEVFRELAVFYAVLAHEWEHAIQLMHLLEGDPGRRGHLKLRAQLLFRVEPGFAMEVGAIQAEYEIASLVTPEMRDASLPILGHLKLRCSNRRRMFARMMDAQGASRAEYLAREHSNGRYSRGSIIEKVALWHALAASGAAASVVGVCNTLSWLNGWPYLIQISFK